MQDPSLMQKEIVHVAKGGYGGAISNLPEPMDLVFWFISYILRFSHQILLCEKAFRILLRPIREAKRVSHT